MAVAVPTIGIFEAKTKLSEILRQVEAGERFTITVRGRAVAEVVPARVPCGKTSQKEREEALERLKNPTIKGVSGEQIRTWIQEGRK